MKGRERPQHVQWVNLMKPPSSAHLLEAKQTLSKVTSRCLSLAVFISSQVGVSCALTLCVCLKTCSVCIYTFYGFNNKCSLMLRAFSSFWCWNCLQGIELANIPNMLLHIMSEKYILFHCFIVITNHGQLHSSLFGRNNHPIRAGSMKQKKD